MTIDIQKKGHIAVITLNRPRALNAFNMAMIKEFSRAIIDCRDDNDTFVLIVTGAGSRAFSAGFDLKEEMPMKFPPMLTRGIEIDKPVIAAVNGDALGGGLEVALACDLRIASENARLGVPETRLGLMPGWGGTQRLPRLISPTKAAEMLLMAKIVDAKEALDTGLVNMVVPPDKLIETAMQWAERICELGPLAVRAAKQSMNCGLSLSLSDGLCLEEKLFGILHKTDDAKEGPRAFKEKRKPRFKGE